MVPDSTVPNAPDGPVRTAKRQAGFGIHTDKCAVLSAPTFGQFCPNRDHIDCATRAKNGAHKLKETFANALANELDKYDANERNN